jgi:hypothetical protein
MQRFVVRDWTSFTGGWRQHGAVRRGAIIFYN